MVKGHEIGNVSISFVAYTALGYLALLLHNSVFARDLADDPTGARVVLIVVNLAAGTWCFLRALRSLWKPASA